MSNRKHFNKGVVFGSLLKPAATKTTTGGTDYLSVQLQAANDLHGNIRVWGKLWGTAAIEEFKSAVKPGMKVRMEGFLQQYVGNEGLVTNFNFFAWRRCPEKDLLDLRAVFVIVAKATAAVPAQGDRPDELLVALELLLQSETKGRVEKETFTFYADPKLLGDGSDLVGKTVSLSGVMQQSEDYFGNFGPTRPMIKEIKVVDEFVKEKGEPKPGADDEVPF